MNSFQDKSTKERESQILLKDLYYINLDRSTIRRKHIENVLKDSIFDNMNKIRISAVDGKTDNLGKYMKVDNYKMMNTEYGCTLSHLEAIRQFSQSTNNPKSCALILEDDVCLDFKSYWKKTLEEIIEESPKDWEIIQLTYIMLGNEPTEQYEFNLPFKNLCSTAAYIINNCAAKRMMNEIYKNGKFHLHENIRHQADCYLYEYFKTYTYKDCPFIYRTENDSLIHPEHVTFHTENKQKIERMLMVGGKQKDLSKYNWIWLNLGFQEFLNQNKYLFIVGILFLLFLLFWCLSTQ
jgi:GR25 family glycosyltransferase involved in LPS biosynthesis